MDVKTISTIFKKPIKDLLNLLGDELKQTFSNKILEYQLEEYKRNNFSKTILHRSTPKLLKEFYEPLFIQRDLDSERISTTSAKKLLEKFNYITLIGNAGSGKSTIVKYLFTKCFKEKYKLPIKIELRYLNESKDRFDDYVFQEIFEYQKLGVTVEIIDRMLSSDTFIFFLDGYDEISSRIKEQTTKDIDSFIKKYPGNKYLITSRPNTHIESFPLFENFFVSKLKEKEIVSFVKRQIPKQEKELANKIILAIEKPRNDAYKAYLSNPLLLSMFILTFQSYSDVPPKRSEFYNQVFETLFSIHDSISKLAYVREKTSGLSKDQFIEILQLLSFMSFFEERFVFSNSYLINKLDTIKAKKKDLKFDNSKFINDLQIAIGILNKEGLDYVFPHRSLQEYFAALYISRLNSSNKKKLYKKIITSMETRKIDHVDRNHFYLILSELDEEHVIEYAILPYFEDSSSIISKLKLDFYTALTEFLKIHRIYNAFQPILDPKEVNKIDKDVYSYRLDEGTRYKIVLEEVKPFLLKFIPEMKLTATQLQKHLRIKKKSDADIIGMI